MVELSETELLARKKSNTLFVLGSGYSINDVTEEEWKIISSFDSVGFNWFCKFDKYGFEPTFFMIREQANIDSRRSKKEKIKNLVKDVNRYSNTTGIIVDVSHHTKKAYQYRHDKRIKMPCAVFTDNKDKECIFNPIEFFQRNPFEVGLYHGDCTMYNVLHFAVFMKYELIVFVGVDLYDSRYFWLDPRDSRHTIRNKGLTWKDRHPVSDQVLNLVRDLAKDYKGRMFTANPKSNLRKAIKSINIKDLSPPASAV